MVLDIPEMRAILEVGEWLVGPDDLRDLFQS